MANKKTLYDQLKERRENAPYMAVRKLILKENALGRLEATLLASRVDFDIRNRLAGDGILVQEYTEHSYKKVRLSWGE